MTTNLEGARWERVVDTPVCIKWDLLDSNYEVLFAMSTAPASDVEAEYSFTAYDQDLAERLGVVPGNPIWAYAGMEISGWPTSLTGNRGSPTNVDGVVQGEFLDAEGMKAVLDATEVPSRPHYVVAGNRLAALAKNRADKVDQARAAQNQTYERPLTGLERLSHSVL